jgi:hypothetical protein
MVKLLLVKSQEKSHDFLYFRLAIPGRFVLLFPMRIKPLNKQSRKNALRKGKGYHWWLLPPPEPKAGRLAQLQKRNTRQRALNYGLKAGGP